MTTETKSPDLGLTIKSTDESVKVQRYGRYTVSVNRNTQNPSEVVLLDLIDLLCKIDQQAEQIMKDKNEDQQ